MSNSVLNNDKTLSNETLGRKLSNARKAQGQSLDKIAEELNILKRYLQAFEDENFSALPQFAYARGFLANYAKYLGLDSNEILQAFERVYPDDLRPPKETISPLKPMDTVVRERSLMRINPWLVAGVIGVVLFGFILLKIISTAVDKNNEPNFDAQPNILTPAQQAQGASLGGSGSAIDLGTTATSSGESVVDIWSKGDVSIKITDKNGNVLMQGLQSRGGYQLKGLPPLTVEIDNPAQVDLNFNQRPIRLGEHTKNGRANLVLSD